MKQKLLLTAFLFLLINAAKANESEPNNNWNQANTLARNGTNNGDLSPVLDVDWWKVTTNADGAINLSLTSTDGRNIYFDLYDTLGTIALHAGTYTNGSTNYTVDGLAQGTYYIKIYCYFGTDTGRYSITNTFTPASVANDLEPNNTKAQAQVLPLNNTKTGHIDYYYHNIRDTFDWYKVTTTADGRLRLRITSHNGQNVFCELFDNNGVTALNTGTYTTSTADINTDGLAAGTYYVRIRTYYNYEFAPYTLSDSLFIPAQANDAEPDSTRGQALTLNLNGSTTGHIDYYYNNHRDSVDWYKVTTNADGRLRLTMTSANGQNVWAYLYDNDGTTLLAGNYTAGSAVVVNQDGLAAGTYYIKVNTYYTYEFAPYTLSDSLFTPTQANDPEPNNTKAQAVTFAQNSTVTGHINYYYNHVKDTADWYKLTTNADGMLNITITSNNGANVWAYLYDNDGTTLINSNYSASSVTYHTDGLAAGTYYLRINVYYENTEFAPYTLSNTLTTYANANDAEPNNYFSQAQTVQSNGTTSGHVNFYYNNAKDAVDIFKINYTGSGNMTLVFNQENRLNFGSADPTWFQVYKDTAVAPISSNYYYSSSGNINLTSLAQGYYYIKIFTYYNGNFSNFSSYSFTNTFTQVNVAKIKATSYDTAGSCSSINTVIFSCSQSLPPYTVQLYRFGAAYGNPVITSKKVTFKNLPDGAYYAAAYGDGATGTAFGKSKTISIEPIPSDLNTSNITATKATLNWTIVPCASYYSVQYKVHDSITWITKKTTGNVGSYALKSLIANTTYDWRVATSDSVNGITATGAYADSITFTTASALVAGTDNGEENLSVNRTNKNQFASLSVSPNPATSFFIISMEDNTSQKLNAMLFDTNGKTVWTSGLINAGSLNGRRVNVSQFAKGIFYLKIMNENGDVAGSAKVIISQ